MKKHIFFVLLISLLTIQSSIGQQNYAWRFGISAGVNNYYGDLNSQLFSNPYQTKQLNPQTFPGKIQANIEHQFSPSWGVSLQAGWGSLSGNDWSRDWQGNLLTENNNLDRGLNFRTEIKDVNLSLVYHFNNDRILRREAKIAPYIYLGAGLAHFNVYGDLFDEDGGRYYYWPDQTIRGVIYDPMTDPDPPIIQQDGKFETALGPLNTESTEGYNPLIIQIPIGLGVDFRVSERFLLGFQGQINYAFSDYLDDVSGNYRTDFAELSLQNYASNPTIRDINLAPNRGNSNGRNDWYSFLGVSIKYQFGGKVKSYKSPKFYGVTYNFEKIDTTGSEALTNNDEVIEEIEDTLEEVVIEDLETKSEISEINDQVEESLEENIVIKSESKAEKTLSEQVKKDQEEVIEEDLVERESELIKYQQIIDSLEMKIEKLEKTNLVEADPVSSDSIKEEIKHLEGKIDNLTSRVDKLESQPDSIFVVYKPKKQEIEKTEVVNYTKTEKLIKEQQKVASQPISTDSTNQILEATETNPVIIPSRGNDTVTVQVEEVLEKTESNDSLLISSQFEEVLGKSEVDSLSIIPIDSIQNNEIDSLQIVVKDTLESVEKIPLVVIDTTDNPIPEIVDTVVIDSIQPKKELVFEADEKQKPEVETQISIKPDTTFIVDTVKINEILGLNKAQVFFSLGSSEIRKSEEETLMATVEILKANPNINVLIKGFADPSGNAQRNLILSQKRAEASSAFLVTQGISQDRIRIERFGDTVQRYGEGALDRRVELELIIK